MGVRRKTIRVTGSFLLALFRGNTHHTFDIFDNGLPADVSLVDVTYHREVDRFVITVESGQFEEVPEGSPPPEIEPTFWAHVIREHMQAAPSVN
jgi:hypothetical protein